MQTIPNRLIDIYIQQGADFEQSYPVTDIANYSFYGCIRKHEDADVFVEFTLATDATSVVISLTSSVTIDMSPKTYIYEVLKKSLLDNKVSLVANGNAIVDPGVQFKDPVPSSGGGSSGGGSGGGTTGDIIIDGGTF
jgi:hypothetical protein